jgi:hypothetical protein
VQQQRECMYVQQQREKQLRSCNHNSISNTGSISGERRASARTRASNGDSGSNSHRAASCCCGINGRCGRVHVSGQECGDGENEGGGPQMRTRECKRGLGSAKEDRGASNEGWGALNKGPTSANEEVPATHPYHLQASDVTGLRPRSPLLFFCLFFLFVY